MLTNFEIFCRLADTWSFIRILNNIEEPLLSGVVTGNASFEKVSGQNNLLHYKEYGTLNTKTGKKHTISKEYFYAFNSSTNNIEKYFAQGGIKTGLFYIIDANRTAEHLCLNDHYQAKYEFNNDSFKEFTLSYKVSGSNKNYISETRYTLT